MSATAAMWATRIKTRRAFSSFKATKRFSGISARTVASLSSSRIRMHPTQVSAVPVYRRMSSSPSSSSPTHILLTYPTPGVLLITLNRPSSLNALSSPLIAELNAALSVAEKDEGIGAVVITGKGRAFAAGADIKEMKDKTYPDVVKNNFIAEWHRLAEFRKPTIAAVNGYALGGGCELALMCDIILASPSAVFGQPEINLGVIPGAGGTQRLARVVGKSRAMELVLTGRTFSADEAERWGVASRVVKSAEAESEGGVVSEAIEMAGVIASKGRLAVIAGKESVNVAFETTLSEGLKTERKLFHALFATKDQKEGMTAFAEKRKPAFLNE